jgi:hypothetical protein
MTQPLLQAADLRGAARLTPDAVAGLTSLVEAMHASGTWTPDHPGLDAVANDESPYGAASAVVESVAGRSRVLDGPAESLLAWLVAALGSPAAGRPPHSDCEAIIAALNGVMGDHLAATDHPLAIRMEFRDAGQPLVLSRLEMRSRLVDATPRPLILLHDLCLNDLQWRRADHDHGAALARELGFTPIYLHYNSGLSVSTNGRILALLMERLFDAWHVPIEHMAMLGHGMGGLVARSALHHAPFIQRAGLRWPARVKALACLGTPHQGAPLQRPEHGVELLLGAAPHVAPLTGLGKLRSAGIRDMRLGNITSAPVGDTGNHQCQQVGLPDSVRCFAVAGSLSASDAASKGNLLDDGLVPVASALGRHHRPDRRLAFADDCQAVVHETDHLDLLASSAVFENLIQWLR